MLSTLDSTFLMIFIAHRALLHGPNKELENQPTMIDKTISLGFHVEVDVWLIDGALFLGHDGPEIPTDLQSLEKWAPYAYYHAKNIFALEFLLQKAREPNSHFKCFYHNVDDYTITSDGKIWAYPGKKLVPGSICVMPEWKGEQEGFSECYGICTDYTQQYGIYDEMRDRQRNDLIMTQQVTVDPLIKPHLVDDRRCFAVYTWYDNWQPTPAFDGLLRDLEMHFPQQNIYAIPKNSTNVLHFTICQIFGFEEYPSMEGFVNQHLREYVQCVEQVLKKYLPFKIIFRGLIALKSGIMVVGYPTFDINVTIRADLIQAFEARGLPYRKYLNNITHSTIVRASEDVPGLAQDMIMVAEQYQDTFFGELVVDRFEISTSSWRMQQSEIDIKGVVSV
ncbi:hypothetical protein EDD86DRAFT_273634 [Gorgonomyces haynaldii]|nr:hypothetical protein EDD86DRAFT_273634 [Gorgonomyces haynaldii]